MPETSVTGVAPSRTTAKSSVSQVTANLYDVPDTNGETGKILAWVGSADYFNQKHAGQVNGVISLRQPGSTLKPFTYGL